MTGAAHISAHIALAPEYRRVGRWYLWGYCRACSITMDRMLPR